MGNKLGSAGSHSSEARTASALLFDFNPLGTGPNSFDLTNVEQSIVRALSFSPMELVAADNGILSADLVSQKLAAQSPTDFALVVISASFEMRARTGQKQYYEKASGEICIKNFPLPVRDIIKCIDSSKPREHKADDVSLFILIGEGLTTPESDLAIQDSLGLIFGGHSLRRIYILRLSGIQSTAVLDLAELVSGTVQLSSLEQLLPSSKLFGMHVELDGEDREEALMSADLLNRARSVSIGSGSAAIGKPGSPYTVWYATNRLPSRSEDDRAKFILALKLSL